MGAGTLHTPVRAVRQVQGTRETAGRRSSSLCALGYLEVTAPSHCWREVPGSSLSHVLMLILSLSLTLSLHLCCDIIHPPCNSPVPRVQSCGFGAFTDTWAHPQSHLAHIWSLQKESLCPTALGFPSASPSPALNNISLSLYIDFLFPCWTFIKMAVDIRWSLSTSFFP